MAVLLFITLVLVNSQECTVKHCRQCGTDNCGSCINDYILKDNTCVFKRDLFCEETFENQCTKCTDGYKMQLSTMTCVKGDELCLDYQVIGSDLQCTSCKPPMSLTNSGECIDCSSTHKGCYLVTDDSCKCTRCKDGYYLNEPQSACIRVPNCLEIDTETQGKCSMCIDGYYVDEKSKNCVQGNLEKCLIYSSANECEFCEENHFWTNGKCVERSHCRVEDGIPDCEYCADGYGIKNNDCVKCPTGCDRCENNATSCEFCLEGYGMVNSVCKKCSDDNCNECDDDTNTCQRCMNGYTLTADNKCKACTKESKCKTCSESTPDVCESCEEGMYFSSEQTCVDCTMAVCSELNNEQCSSCNIMYKCKTVYDGDVSSCIDISHCSNYDENRKQCTECFSEYFLDDNYKCQQCDEKCVNGCAKNKSTCIELKDVRSEDYCLLFDVNHNCKKCDDRAVLKDGICSNEDNCWVKNDDDCCVEYLDNNQTGRDLNNNPHVHIYPMSNCQDPKDGSFSIFVSIFGFIILAI
ncbi:hypothetical protein EIN_300520 [Entamoeba invadens IP1]|uniref:Furin repeat-containing protein n=1 Tax=Entamoeba invadens IP1 TaxID=370355 RepID=A0A0A1U6B9_ENTIV|nr:hypothetical protein EIN_300520 [Entamoeba invadens IP1]ELP89953.1 hypothetical protein EIN_300520 [Entamoeba invadens IP1]|eukprot:XP_004256724.1 hypothetical protein EIN_300520 [Entamoeba invadens IP1]